MSAPARDSVDPYSCPTDTPVAYTVELKVPSIQSLADGVEVNKLLELFV